VSKGRRKTHKKTPSKKGSPKTNLSGEKVGKERAGLLRVLVCATAGVGVVVGVGVWADSPLIVLTLVTIFVALSVAIIAYKRKRLSIGTAVMLICVIAFSFVVFSYQPFSYNTDEPKPFAFYSDGESVTWLKYDNCLVESLYDATSDSVNLRLACHSPEWTGTQDETFALAWWDKCGNVSNFTNDLLTNETPDYLVVFPFDIRDIGISCMSKIYVAGKPDVRYQEYVPPYPVEVVYLQLTDGRIVPVLPEELYQGQVDLTGYHAGHYNNSSNSLIVEWKDYPITPDIEFTTGRLFKKISFEKMAINYYISEDIMMSHSLFGNVPGNLTLELRIPKSYRIENQELYNISYTTNNQKQLKGLATVTEQLKVRETLHLVITNKAKDTFKTASGWFFVTVALAFIVNWVNERMKREGKNNTRKV